MKKEVAYAQTWIYDVYTKGEAYYCELCFRGTLKQV